MLHLEMLEVYPSFSPGAEASLSRFCSGPGKQTATHDILKEKIGSTLAKLGSGVIQRERSYHGGWEWKIIGTPFRKGFIMEKLSKNTETLFSGTFGTGDQQRAMIAVLCQIIRIFNSAGWKLGRWKHFIISKYQENIFSQQRGHLCQISHNKARQISDR